MTIAPNVFPIYWQEIILSFFSSHKNLFAILMLCRFSENIIMWQIILYRKNPNCFVRCLISLAICMQIFPQVLLSYWSDLSSLQNDCTGNLAWVSVRGHHVWPWGENLWILGPQILGKWHFSPSFLRHRHSVTLWICVTNSRNSKCNNFIPTTFSAKIPLARAW